MDCNFNAAKRSKIIWNLILLQTTLGEETCSAGIVDVDTHEQSDSDKASCLWSVARNKHGSDPHDAAKQLNTSGPSETSESGRYLNTLVKGLKLGSRSWATGLADWTD